MSTKAVIHSLFLESCALSLESFAKPSIWERFSTKMNFFMQNKANFQKVKFYVSRVSTKGYAKWTLGGIGKTKPNKANSKPISKTPK